MRGGLFILVLILGAVGATRSHGSPISVDPEKECYKVWNAKGFTNLAEPNKNYLYSQNGSEKYDDFYTRIDRGNCWKEWVVLIYMAADNDLSPYAYRDLWEMETVGSAPSVDYLVFHDALKEDGARYYHMSRRPKLFDYRPLLEKYIKDNGLESSETKEQEELFWEAEGPGIIKTPPAVSLDELDSGNLKSASDFVQWALKRYPGRRVMVIGWSHGEGFDAKELEVARALAARSAAPAAPIGRQGGFAFDYTSKSHIPVNQLGRALKTTVETLRDGNTIDIAGSDSCLNQQIEFGFEGLGVADFIFGSSSVVQTKGFNYKTLFHEIARAPYTSTEKFAKMFPRIYGMSVNGSAASIFKSYKDPNATMATWDMRELKNVQKSMDQLADHLVTWLKAPADQIDRIDRRDTVRAALLEAVHFANVSYDLTNLMQTLDVWARDKEMELGEGEEKDFYRQTRDLATDTMRKVRTSVAENYIGEAYRLGLIQVSQGVAVWIPTTRQEYKEMYPKFKLSRFYQSDKAPGELTSWAKFVSYLWEKLE